jgi:hypothetical protein
VRSRPAYSGTARAKTVAPAQAGAATTSAAEGTTKTGRRPAVATAARAAWRSTSAETSAAETPAARAGTTPAANADSKAERSRIKRIMRAYRGEGLKGLYGGCVGNDVADLSPSIVIGNEGPQRKVGLIYRLVENLNFR